MTRIVFAVFMAQQRPQHWQPIRLKPKAFYMKLVVLVQTADTEPPEIGEAQTFLAAK